MYDSSEPKAPPLPLEAVEWTEAAVLLLPLASEEAADDPLDSIETELDTDGLWPCLLLPFLYLCTGEDDDVRDVMCGVTCIASFRWAP